MEIGRVEGHAADAMVASGKSCDEGKCRGLVWERVSVKGRYLNELYCARFLELAKFEVGKRQQDVQRASPGEWYVESTSHASRIER